MSTLSFTQMSPADFVQFWPDFKAIVSAGETYAIDPDIDFDTAYALWCQAPKATFAVKDAHGELLGAYYLKANAEGPGGHICNCGYMVAARARGKGVARAMCEHSQEIARGHGFLAMQYNAVVATNDVAIALWQKLGFHIVGTVPSAYQHARLGFVDTLVMYKAL